MNRRSMTLLLRLSSDNYSRAGVLAPSSSQYASTWRSRIAGGSSRSRSRNARILALAAVLMLPWVLRTVLVCFVGLPKRRNRITATCSSVPGYEAYRHQRERPRNASKRLQLFVDPCSHHQPTVAWMIDNLTLRGPGAEHPRAAGLGLIGLATVRQLSVWKLGSL
jgi:hypothetical protein